MRNLQATLARLAPLLFIVIVVALLRLLAMHTGSSAGGVHLARGAARTLLFLAIVLWLLTLFGQWHARVTRASQEAAASRRPVGDAGTLAKTLKAKIVGRDGTCDDIAAQVQRRLAYQSRSRPVGVFVLAGPDGVGKTYLAQVLANVLGRPFVHLEMADHARGGAHAHLFGSSRGILDAYTHGTLTAVLRDTPDAVILLQDFEKAHTEVQARIVAALGEGVVIEASDGRAFPITQAIVVMTTDVAIDVPRDLAERPADSPGGGLSAATQALLAAGWTLEVLQRVDRVFVLRPLAEADSARVAALDAETSRFGASRFGHRFDAAERAAAAPASRWRLGSSAWPIAAALVTLVAGAAIARDHLRDATTAEVVAQLPSAASSAADLPPPAPAATELDEQRALAVCHPGLAHSPGVPRMDVHDLPEPEIARLKFRFWVNGSGAVVRDKLIGGTLGTPAERVAAQTYLYQTTYNIPNFGDCRRRREIELVGNFFLRRDRQGKWETLVAVHPLYWLDENDMLQVSD